MGQYTPPKRNLDCSAFFGLPVNFSLSQPSFLNSLKKSGTSDKPAASRTPKNERIRKGVGIDNQRGLVPSMGPMTMADLPRGEVGRPTMRPRAQSQMKFQLNFDSIVNSITTQLRLDPRLNLNSIVNSIPTKLKLNRKHNLNSI